jgi:hypothetical protein
MNNRLVVAPLVIEPSVIAPDNSLKMSSRFLVSDCRRATSSLTAAVPLLLHDCWLVYRILSDGRQSLRLTLKHGLFSLSVSNHNHSKTGQERKLSGRFKAVLSKHVKPDVLCYALTV